LDMRYKFRGYIFLFTLADHDGVTFMFAGAMI
jgi:hypothetical protein